MKNKNLENFISLVALPLILAVCLALWINMSGTPHTEIESGNGVWDLRGFDFNSGSVSVRGPVEFIPNVLLTPEEFEAREDEIQIGRPEDVCQYSTSRIRILLPDGVTYALARRSTDYAEPIFVNGEHVADIGKPGKSRETMIPNTANLIFMCEPKGGAIATAKGGDGGDGGVYTQGGILQGGRPRRGFHRREHGHVFGVVWGGLHVRYG